MKSIFLTGASGFIGTRLYRRLFGDGFTVTVATRQNVFEPVNGVKFFKFPILNGSTNWSSALHGQDVVIHCAGETHFSHRSSKQSWELMKEVNIAGTLNLARQAALVGVRRLVFLSTVGVNGWQTRDGKLFSERDISAPQDNYSLSKWEAERGLHRVSAETGLEVVIVRAPLVYGPNAPGKFGILMRAVKSGWPLPFSSINNMRSFIGVDNLVDFLVTCAVQQQAANETFLINDCEDVSVASLVRDMAREGDISARLVPFPSWALMVGAELFGKGEVIRRLICDLQIDSSKAINVLGWVPPASLREGLKRAMCE